MRIASGIVENTAGEDAVAPPYDAAAHLDLDRPHGPVAVAHARRRHTVGDEDDAPACRSPRHARCVVRDVVAVEDQLDSHVVARERRTGDAWIAVRERAHRVEEVRHVLRAAVEGGMSLLGRRVGVTARDGDTAFPEQVDELERTGELRASVTCATEPVASASLEQGDVGVATSARRMHAQPIR